jgi:nicotinamidase/pyrazinamidase
VKTLEIKDLKFEQDIKITKHDALIIVDMQYDFMPSGALPVLDGDQIIEGINKISKKFKDSNAKVVLTQDWHPKDHLSFASNHPGKNPGDEYQTESIGPVLWPDHCVQGSNGAEIHREVQIVYANAIIRKGYNPKIDSYSAFIENDKKSETGLAGYLKSLNIKRIFICGLALDYCCYFTAIDGLNFGFETYFLANLTKGIDTPPGNISRSLKNMQIKGVKFVNEESFQ